MNPWSARFTDRGGHNLLPYQREIDRNKKTLVVDLDETLVHSRFHTPDVPVDIEIGVELEG